MRGQVRTNGIETFWSLLKRSNRGTCISVEPYHFSRYLDEQTFRFNNRKDDDDGRFEQVCKRRSETVPPWRPELAAGAVVGLHHLPTDTRN